jgi:hypothetical protein
MISKTNQYESNEMLSSVNKTVEKNIKDFQEHKTGMESFSESKYNITQDETSYTENEPVKDENTTPAN